MNKIITDISENITGNISCVSKVKKIIDYLWKYRKLAYKKIGYLGADVIVVGRPGVGKSVLIEHCQENKIMQTNKEIESPSRNTEISIIENKNGIKMLVVMQGQNLKTKRQDLQKALKYKRVKALMIVVDYGYTEIRIEGIKKELEKSKTLEDLIVHNLKVELEELKKTLTTLRPFMDDKKGPEKIVIVLNKIDLYYSELQKAKEYYFLDKESNFVKVINEFINEYGKSNIGLELLTVCSLMKNCKWNKEEKRTELTQTQEKNEIFSKFYSELEKII